MIYGKSIFVVVLGALTLSACGANWNSISRRTWLPSPDPYGGRAIHLDAKQRLVVANSLGKVCAEPSPDALSAYAAALSGAASVPSQGAGSVAGAQQETAASIGLRTQSITLMRDALYRLCEAYYNGQLSQAQVMLLLSRSQDLTAAIVAVEQLTGAVVAQQAALSSAAGASSAAALVANTKALEQMQTLQKKKADELAEAKKKQEEANTALIRNQEAVKGQKEEIKSTSDPDERARLEKELDTLNDQLSASKQTLAQADSNVALLQKQLDDITTATNAIASQLDSAITNASVTASGTSVLGASSSRGGLTLSDTSADTITRGVKEIVTTVLGKKYIIETCIALLTNPPPSGAELPLEYHDTVRLCHRVIQTGAQAESEKFEKLIEGGVGIGGTFDPDRCSKALESFSQPGGIINPTNEALVEAAVKQAGARKGLPMLLYEKALSDDRHRVGVILGLPDCK